MPLKNTLLFLGLSLATLIGFILKSLSKCDSDNDSSYDPFTKLMSQAVFVVLTLAMWGVLIFSR